MTSRSPSLAVLLPFFAALIMSPSSSVLADVRLPGYYSDHMVLQRDMPLRIRGSADPGEGVSVSFNGETATAQADDAGAWQVELPKMSANKEPQPLTVKGNNTIEFSDILIGEVWLCSGQSNMQWSVRASSNADEEIAAANYPLIRHVAFTRRPSPVPLPDISAEWQVCSPDTVAGFTAVGYFMGRTLHKELDVPIGLVHSSWGGTRIEPWTPPVGFERVAALGELYQQILGRTPGTAQHKDLLQKHIKATEVWLKKAQAALTSGEIIKASPAFPSELAPLADRQDPTALYNGMIHGLVGFPIRGAIWYQGESNHVEGMQYYEKMKALINGWRELWKQGDFPFYYVQIAPFQYGNEDPAILAELWEAQAAALELPNTGMAVINDIATLKDIHPPNKQDVGYRLALLALKQDYGRNDLVARSPEMESVKVQDGKLKVTFRHTGGGLKTRDGKAPSHFEVVGAASGGFQPAVATIEGDTVTLSSPDVKSPTAFRFAWHKLAEPNLTGGTGLPVGAVRGGEVPSFADTIPNLDDYQLVYDLDLKRLGGRQVDWNVDNSTDAPAFDRIAYLLELSSGRASQNVFVSMDAFTDNPKHIGVPTAPSKVTFRQSVDNLTVFSDVDGVASGVDVGNGYVEFWPNNYGPINSADVPGASNDLYDFGDEPSGPRNGYGSMQVHNPSAKQTIFAINHWSQGAGADIGIGNSKGRTRDWTFSGNAGSWRDKRLRIYVSPTRQ